MRAPRFAALGKAARRDVVERYGMDAMVAAYDSLYRAASARMLANPRIQDTPLPRPVKPSVLQLGPLPPLTGGMATVACNLRDSDLRHLCDLETINNGKTTPEGRSLVAGVRAQAQLLYGVLSTIRRRRIQLAHIHTSPCSPSGATLST